MEYETISADDFGAGLRGLGVNLLVRDVASEVDFLTAVLGMQAYRQSADFAILTYAGHVMQLHADPTYATHPLHDLLPENPPRGAGASLHAFESDPDNAAASAEAHGGLVLQAPMAKPHGLRETCLLSPAGYAWVASRPLSMAERAARG